jgi:hypothetical protein
MIYTLHFAVLAVACPLAAVPLVRAGWAVRAPRTAIVCWQALALTWTLSVIGTVIGTGLAPYRLGIAPGLARAGRDLIEGQLVGVLGPARDGMLLAGMAVAAGAAAALVVSTVETHRTRRRHRQILSLVAQTYPDMPGALVVDHPVSVGPVSVGPVSMSRARAAWAVTNRSATAASALSTPAARVSCSSVMIPVAGSAARCAR